MRVNRERFLPTALRDLWDWPRNWPRPDESWKGDLARGTDFTFSPACEAKEDGENFVFKFDLPGISKEDLSIEINQNQLTVSGERKEEHKDKKNHFSEIYYGSFMRSFTLPSEVDPDKILAEHNNGILEIRIPKEETKKASRSVKVK